MIEKSINKLSKVLSYLKSLMLWACYGPLKNMGGPTVTLASLVTLVKMEEIKVG